MSLFPEVDDEISEIKVELHKFIQNIIDESKMYAPSNGSEGHMFVGYYCDQCPMDNGEDKICDIQIIYMLNGSHKDIRIDKNGSFLCASSPMFKKLAEDKFYYQRRNNDK